MTNFTVLDFLRRSQKISLLNDIKCDQLSEEDNKERLSFPAHYKHKQDSQLSSLQHLDYIDKLDIEKIISDAFDQAIEITERLEISNLLLEHNLFDLNSLSKYVFQQMKSNSKMFNHSAQAMDSGSDESSLDEDESERIDENNLSSKDDQSDEEIRLAEEEDDDDDDDAIETIKTNFNGIKIHDHIQPSMNDSYFKVDINGHRKFIHKQSACWLLT